jgi:hypothetical protein
MTFLFDIVNGILGNGIGILRDYLEGKRKAAQAELDTKLSIEKAKQEVAGHIQEGEALHNIRWEEIQAEGSKDSWKDEWFTVVLSLPFLLSMFGLSSWADRAFEAMRKAPDWYTMAFLVAVGASFGVRIWDNFKPGDKK